MHSQLIFRFKEEKCFLKENLLIFLESTSPRYSPRHLARQSDVIPQDYQIQSNVILQHDQIENELIQDTLDIHIVVEDTIIISPGITV